MEKLGLYTVDTEYVKALHDVDSEVFFESTGYSNKPYVGIITSCGDHKYFIPLTSAKRKHLTWKNVTSNNYLIYETIPAERFRENSRWIYKMISIGNKQYIKHILSVLEIKKMIPVPENCYHYIDFDLLGDESYRALLLKEYDFIKPISETITSKANNIYTDQIKTGKVFQFYCNFKKLENICDTYKIPAAK